MRIGITGCDLIMSIESQKSDFEWYKANFSDLYNEYGSCVVAIRNKNVLGIYKDFSSAYEATLHHNPNGSFILQKLGPDKDSYTEYIYNMYGGMSVNG